MRHRRGFTLIELLVVIAIIAILAAMLFPVFARARESARKIQCLSNVKNIAIAIQIYLTDYDRFLPNEHRQDVLDYMYDNPGGGTMWGAAANPPSSCQHNADNANPYLRWPVILDEYVKNRDIWRCPSAKMQGGPYFINPATPDWLTYLRNNEGKWGSGKDLCIKDNCFPPGWGGAVTDSCLQGAAPYEFATGSGSRDSAVFVQTISCNGTLRGKSISAISDASSAIVCGDGGPWTEMMSLGLLAYADLCNLECANCSCADWREDGGCYDEQVSGCPECALNHARGGSDPKTNFLLNRELRKPYARHLGGTNIGFADGHANWWTSEGLIAKAKETTRSGCWGNDTMQICHWGPTSDCGFTGPAIW
jgi:prepilin-type N-terminal cleavage/methylation domain-containing protein/prepilin-type processing-associated H-X9-DG protein